jgi:hypothetical protein
MRVELRGKPEYRGLSSTDGAGGEFIPPAWMMDEWVPLACASRAFANAVARVVYRATAHHRATSLFFGGA